MIAARAARHDGIEKQQDHDGERCKPKTREQTLDGRREPRRRAPVYPEGKCGDAEKARQQEQGMGTEPDGHPGNVGSAKQHDRSGPARAAASDQEEIDTRRSRRHLDVEGMGAGRKGSAVDLHHFTSGGIV